MTFTRWVKRQKLSTIRIPTGVIKIGTLKRNFKRSMKDSSYSTNIFKNNKYCILKGGALKKKVMYKEISMQSSNKHQSSSTLGCTENHIKPNKVRYHTSCQFKP